MTVFIVERGERGEGSSILGVFRTRVGALKRVQEEMAKPSDGEKWRPMLEREDWDLWESGVDRLGIQMCRVEP